MGWNSDYVVCPNCGCQDQDKVDSMCRNSMLSDLYIVCYNCGFHAHAEGKVWEITSCYVDEFRIREKINHDKPYYNNPRNIVNENENDESIKSIIKIIKPVY